MTKDEAWDIIEACKGIELNKWCRETYSSRFVDAINDYYLARINALEKAWKVIGEQE